MADPYTFETRQEPKKPDNPDGKKAKYQVMPEHPTQHEAYKVIPDYDI